MIRYTGGSSKGVSIHIGWVSSMGSSSAMIEKELQKEILSGDVEEEVYADTWTSTNAEYLKAVSGTIPDGYEGIVMGLATSYLSTIDAYLKKKGKHVYANGLATLALSNVAQANGVGDEVPLLVKIGEKEEWELGFKASAGAQSVNWRLRVRVFKKT